MTTGSLDRLTYPTRGLDGMLTWIEVPSGSGHARETFGLLNSLLVSITPFSELQAIDDKLVAIKRNILDRVRSNKKRSFIMKWAVSVVLHCKYAWLARKLHGQMQKCLQPFHAWRTQSFTDQMKLWKQVDSVLFSKLSQQEQEQLEFTLLYSQDYDTVKETLQKLPKLVNFCTSDLTFLDKAVQKNDVDFMRFIIDRMDCSTIETFLTRKSLDSRFEVVDFCKIPEPLLLSLFDKVVTDAAPWIVRLISEVNKRKELIKTFGNIQVVENVIAHLIAKCPDDKLKDSWRQSFFNGPLLNIVIPAGLLHTARVILKRNVDPNAVDQDGDTALHKAAEYAPEIVQELLDKGGNPNVCNKGGYTALHKAAKYAPEIVQKLLDRGGNPNVRNTCGATPLHLARNYEAAHALLSAGAKVDATDNIGETPLFYSSRDPKLLELLLKAGANPNVVNWKGKTCLHSARDSTTVMLLLKAGANPNSTDEEGKTPLHQEGISKEAMELLLAHDGRIDLCDKDKRTPLFYAVYGNKAEVVQLLLERGANPNVKDSCGNTPLSSAQGRYGASHEIVKLLETKT